MASVTKDAGEMWLARARVSACSGDAKALRDLEYEQARAIGERRFGSECRHDRGVVDGQCTCCLRKVVYR